MSILGYKPSDHGPEGLLNRIGKDIVALHDWLSGPPMTDRDRIKYRAVRARAELRVMEMCLMGSWKQHPAILHAEELLDESADSQRTRNSGPGGLRTEQQSRSVVARFLV